MSSHQSKRKQEDERVLCWLSIPNLVLKRQTSGLTVVQRLNSIFEG
jgi:hypothetical protein